jgi:hypothetical protein
MKQSIASRIIDIGLLTTTTENDYIVSIDFGMISPENYTIPIIHEAFRQLSECLAGTENCSLRLILFGADFQKSIWEA